MASAARAPVPACSEDAGVGGVVSAKPWAIGAPQQTGAFLPPLPCL